MQKNKIKIVSNGLKSSQKECGKIKMRSSRGKRWIRLYQTSQNENQILLLFIFLVKLL